jgi:quinol monooxygenase YgiN
MWLNCTRTKVDLNEVGRAIEILSSDASLAPIRAARGFRGLLLIESTDVPGEIISITWWESAEEGQAYLAGPECQRVVRSVEGYLAKPLERSYYEVLLLSEV